ncbi:MAG: hypothetical protein R2711_08155 [Acidimicrobiales bacterium]
MSRSSGATAAARPASPPEDRGRPSGPITEKIAPSWMSWRSVAESAWAPPLPPSPTHTDTVGTGADAMARWVRAMARAMPAFSASGSTRAPGVSTNVAIGTPRRLASSIARHASA